MARPSMTPFSFTLISLVALAALTFAAAAEGTHQSICGVVINARFIEGAPTDRFEIENASANGWSISSATFDLSQTPAGLVFDTEDGGGGLEVFQPFKAAESSAKLGGISGLTDGGTTLILNFTSFAPGETFAFTIDIDDSLENSARRQTQVVGSEIEGVSLRASAARADGRSIVVEGVFATDASVNASTSEC
ncbi:MAG: hypothetical protein AAGH82_08430 [Pseudomonadota bacterium]